MTGDIKLVCSSMIVVAQSPLRGFLETIELRGIALASNQQKWQKSSQSKADIDSYWTGDGDCCTFMEVEVINVTSSSVSAPSLAT